MRTSFLDPDFRFEKSREQAEVDREIRRQIAEARRTKITGVDPHAKKSTPWKVNRQGTADAAAAWEIERAAGKPTHFRETVPSKKDTLIETESGAKNRSVFVMRITSACFVGGHATEVGDLVTCFGGTASALIGSGRVNVLEETRPA